MVGPERVVARKGVLLWEMGSLVCTCETVAPDHIEIRLRMDGTLVQDGRFGNQEEAAQFAIDLLRRYQTV